MQTYFEREDISETKHEYYNGVIVAMAGASPEHIRITTKLSPSTGRADRGTKFDCYRTLGSMHAYVLVAQDEPRIELFSRQADGSWRYDVAIGLDAVLRLEAIRCVLQIAEVYARVEFPPTLTEQTAE